MRGLFRPTQPAVSIRSDQLWGPRFESGSYRWSTTVEPVWCNILLCLLYAHERLNLWRSPSFRTSIKIFFSDRGSWTSKNYDVHAEAHGIVSSGLVKDTCLRCDIFIVGRDIIFQNSSLDTLSAWRRPDVYTHCPAARWQHVYIAIVGCPDDAFWHQHPLCINKVSF